MDQLIARMFLTSFSNPILEQKHDSAQFELSGVRLAFTTDSFVVHPLFFPGGDIGTLAINGTVNDLAMSGAKPLFLSCGMILEEGLPMETLWRVVNSMKKAAELANVQIVTGDTKVVDAGKGDGIYINTSGIGVINHKLTIAPSSVQPGDIVILSGDIGSHAMAVMACREGLSFETTIESDCAPLASPVLELIQEGIEVHCLRDLTRGGLASALSEIAESAKLAIRIRQKDIPVHEQVKGACEMLGFDPLYTANEGRFVAFVPPKDAERAISILKRHSVSKEACTIGQTVAAPAGQVIQTSLIGTDRIVDRLSGEQLPPNLLISSFKRGCLQHFERNLYRFSARAKAAVHERALNWLLRMAS